MLAAVVVFLLAVGFSIRAVLKAESRKGKKLEKKGSFYRLK